MLVCANRLISFEAVLLCAFTPKSWYCPLSNTPNESPDARRSVTEALNIPAEAMNSGATAYGVRDIGEQITALKHDELNVPARTETAITKVVHVTQAGTTIPSNCINILRC